jgi:hypothetical protein
MAVELLKDEYKTPLAVVRGVFLCEKMAVSGASFKYGELELEDWTPDPTPTAPTRTGDVSLYF